MIANNHSAVASVDMVASYDNAIDTALNDLNRIPVKVPTIAHVEDFSGNASDHSDHSGIRTVESLEIWALNFRAEGDGPPTAIRVRRLRSYGLRCTDYRHAVDSGVSDVSEAIEPSELAKTSPAAAATPAVGAAMAIDAGGGQ
jgi:hypothetical protein